MEKELFELIDGIGEQLTRKLHIIDTTDYISCPEYKKYRVYHSKGYCFDVECFPLPPECDNVSIYEYACYDEWDGFEKLDIEGYIKLIKENG